MLVHVGNGCMVRKKSIIGIFDIEKTTVIGVTKDFLSNAEKENLVTNAAEDFPKTFILTDDNMYSGVYLSQLSADTLKKRLMMVNFEEEV